MGKYAQSRQRLKHSSPRSIPAPTLPLPAVQSARRTSYTGLGVVLLIFLILATLYSLVVPITQGEDELAHYRYLSFIAQTGRLPQNAAERQQAWYRADWPPLYHLLVGWAVSPLDTTRPPLKDVGESPRRRLVGEIFYPRLIIYTEDANWPWQDGILAWHLGRFISIIFSAGALVFTYLTVLEICRGGEEAKKRGGEGQESKVIAPSPHFSSPPPASLLALAVTALLAFTPRFLFTSAMLGDDSLFILLSAIFIWLLLRVARGDERWQLYALIGLVLGLSVVTKYSTGLLPLAVIPTVIWRAGQAGWSWRRASGRVALTWLFTLIGASWWFGWIGYYFNTVKTDGLFFGLLKPLLASGPDVSMRRVFAVFGGGEFTGLERPGAIAAGTFWGWLTYLFQTFWGVPVLEHDPFFPWGYLIILLFCLLALVGLWQFWRTATAELRIILGLLGLVVALLLPFPILRFFLTRNILETGQGRHLLYPAAQAIPILLVLGWAVLAKKIEDSKQSLSGNTSAVLHPLSSIPYPLSSILIFLPSLLLLLWSLFQLGYMAVAYPAPLPVRTTTFDSASIPQPLKHNFGEAIQLLGYDFVPDAEQATVNLTLFWKSLKPVGENYRVQVQLVDNAGRPHFTWLSHPLNGRYPTRAWDKGDVIRDTLPLPLAAVPANRYDLRLNLLREAEDTPLAGEPLEFIQIPLVAQPPIPGSTRLGGAVDYRLWVGDTPARPRQTLPLSWSYADASAAAQSSLSGFQSRAPQPAWALVGPDDVPRLPQATGDATTIFIVGPDWPSGPYHLQLDTGQDSYQTEPLLTVANDARLFALPSLPAGWTPVEANFANRIKLLGYVLPTRRVEPGGALPLTLSWQSLAPVLPDLLTYAVLLDAQQQPYGSVDRYPSGFYSPMLWAEREIIVDSFTVPVQADAPPGVYALHVGQYQLVSGQPQSLALVEGGQAADATAVVIGPIKVGGPPPGVTITEVQPQFPLNQFFGGQITLLGYDREQNCQQATVNCQLAIKLYWRADTVPAADYTTFLHLRDAANETVAQKDSPPAAGHYPTGLWEAGEIIVDEITLPLAGLPPGEYTPVVGLYEFATGNRLATPGQPANELRLRPIQIKE
ncbi:MAG: hypothetical protein BroJett011_70140 [Chloroflexota bacterium]|nr:MAG: hypothetical protein BroJett011_70140 [Chloroflexota bacterium]